MGQLTAQDLLSKSNLKIEKVDLGEGNFVFVKQMTAREHDKYTSLMVKKVLDDKGVVVSYENDVTDFSSKLAVCTVCDAEGNLLFTEADVELLATTISTKMLKVIVEVASELNKVDDENKKKERVKK